MIALQMAHEVQKYIGTNYCISEENNGDITIECFLICTGVEKGNLGWFIRKKYSDGIEVEEAFKPSIVEAIRWTFSELIRYDYARKIQDVLRKY